MGKTTITVRLDSSVIQEIDSKCNIDSCTRTDFIKDAIKEKLENIEPVKSVSWTVYDDYGNVIGQSKN